MRGPLVILSLSFYPPHRPLPLSLSPTPPAPPQVPLLPPRRRMEAEEGGVRPARPPPPGSPTSRVLLGGIARPIHALGQILSPPPRPSPAAPTRCPLPRPRLPQMSPTTRPLRCSAPSRSSAASTSEGRFRLHPRHLRHPRRLVGLVQADVVVCSSARDRHHRQHGSLTRSQQGD
jgi:hypothetical protein